MRPVTGPASTSAYRSIEVSTEDGVEPDIENMRIRQACEDIILCSYQLVDSGAARQVLQFFTKDGGHILNGHVAEGPDLERFFEEREAMADRDTRHIVTNIRYRRESRSEATMRYMTMLCVLPEASPRAVTDVTDRFIRDGASERWLLAQRKIEIVAGTR